MSGFTLLSLHITDIMAGHDPLDSTTVPEKYPPVSLPDEVSLKGLHIGIPKVTFYVHAIVEGRY